MISQLVSREFGAILLVSGCCIGAGMLGVPIATGIAGFAPSVVLFLFAWTYMLATGLLLLEVNLAFSDTNVSIISIVDRILGSLGRRTAWLTFLFLFYCAMTAYVAGTGSLIRSATASGLINLPSLPLSMIYLVTTLFMGLLIFFGTRFADRMNRFLMAGLIVVYLLLVRAGLPNIHTSLLTHHNWEAVLFALPPMIFSFGYHNLIPSLTRYLRGSSKSLVTTLCVGSAIPLVVYLLWDLILLGTIPLELFKTALSNAEMITLALAQSEHGQTTTLMQLFGLFAILTSFLAVALSFVDFLRDGLHLPDTKWNRLLVTVLTLAPPFIFSCLRPGIFQVALGLGGGVATVILFGILPVLMVWKCRYGDGLKTQPILPGGRFALAVIFLISLFVMGVELSYEFGWIHS
ncbi:MAG: tyrosine transporter [Chlamydiia bacterium]|nr:tyrosine transporter [Chlamydiia bacterium]